MAAKRLYLIFTLGIICLAHYGSVNAEPVRYITDEFQITMRTGTSTQHQIVRLLRSGDKVELLETDSESGYSKVRASSGDEGWVLNRYLVDVPSARDRLDDTKKRLVNLEIKTNRLEEEADKLAKEKRALEKERQQLIDENRRLNQQLKTIQQKAADVLTIDNENKALKGKVVDLERKVQSLQQENDVLKDRRDRDWFIAGALVLGGGILLGLVLPKVRVKRKSRWESL